MTAQELKTECEAIWNCPGVQHRSNAAIWELHGECLVSGPGERREWKAAPMRKVKGYDKWPKATFMDKRLNAPLAVPAWYRERCADLSPAWRKALIDSYGKLDKEDMGTFPLLFNTVEEISRREVILSMNIEEARFNAEMEEARIRTKLEDQARYDRYDRLHAYLAARKLRLPPVPVAMIDALDSEIVERYSPPKPVIKRRRVSAKKLAATLVIIGNLDRAEMPAFFVRFGGSFEIATQIAANDNLPEIARQFLKIALAA